MTVFFVPQKDTLPRVRLLVFVFYVIGFAILSIPTAEVFWKVSRSFLGSLLEW
jgi:hypothetical protein